MRHPERRAHGLGESQRLVDLAPEPYCVCQPVEQDVSDGGLRGTRDEGRRAVAFLKLAAVDEQVVERDGWRANAAEPDDRFERAARVVSDDTRACPVGTSCLERLLGLAAGRPKH